MLVYCTGARRPPPRARLAPPARPLHHPAPPASFSPTAAAPPRQDVVTPPVASALLAEQLQGAICDALASAYEAGASEPEGVE